MRNAFLRELVNLAENDSKIVLLSGDLGFSVLEPFAAKFPDRFVNIGVAEQNMVGVAAGMALSGKKVFTYSIVNFAVTRCLEQIRNDVCYHNLDVTVVAVGGGVAYGAQGYTHHGMEDIAFTRVLPNIMVVAPADPVEARWAMQGLGRRKGPAYLRLNRGGEPPLHVAPLDSARFGRLLELCPADDVAVIATGSALGEAKIAAERLGVGLFSAPVLSPFDEEGVRALARRCRIIATVEEHLVMGGLGGAVAEIVAEMPASRARVIRFGLNHHHLGHSGSQTYLRKLHGMDADAIAACLQDKMRE
ncbi:Transketolase [Azospirillaceae bacterium]